MWLLCNPQPLACTLCSASARLGPIRQYSKLVSKLSTTGISEGMKGVKAGPKQSKRSTFTVECILMSIITVLSWTGSHLKSAYAVKAVAL